MPDMVEPDRHDDLNFGSAVAIGNPKHRVPSSGNGTA